MSMKTKDTEMSATFSMQLRHAEMEAERAFTTLRDSPDYQPEAIANHYCKLAMLARDLHRLLECRKQAQFAGVNSDNAAQLIARIVEDIKREHWHDFGLPLEWNL